MMNKLKEKVLKDLMNYADGLEGEKLKNHPKLVAAKVTVAKPIAEDEKEKIIEMMNGDKGENEPMHEEKEEPEMEKKESGDEYDLENLDPEMIQKLLKLIK